MSEVDNFHKTSAFSALVDEGLKQKLRRTARILGLPQDSVLRLVIHDYLRRQSLRITELPDLEELASG